MSANKNLNLTQLRRISLLLSYLKRSPYKSKDEILEYFKENDKSFTARTFYRLKETLDTDFDIQIIFNYTRGGYFFDEENSSNTESFLSLLEILVTAELFSGNFNEKTNTLQYVEFENTANIENIENFKTILNSIQEQVPISFDHYSFYHLKDEGYTLKPYLLKQYQNRWYVIGETPKGYRTFGIDRIKNIKVGTAKFKPKTQEAIDRFSHVIGLNYEDHPLERIKLSFHISQKPYLNSLPLHRTQKELVSNNKDCFDIELDIHPNFEFSQQVLKYGSLVKVLEPKWLAIKIKNEIKIALENYE